MVTCSSSLENGSNVANYCEYKVTNVSIFDRPYLESLFGGVEFPDGTFAIDHIEDLIEFQKVFMDVVSEIREVNMFTYPVLSYSLLYKDGHFVDEDFARYSSDHNCRWSDANFFVSDNVGVLSNCPMSADTKILYWSERYNEFKLSPIKELYFNHSKEGRKETISVISNGELVECKINQFDDAPIYEIELVNGAKIKTTPNHLNLAYGKKYVATKDLTNEDYLPYSITPYNSSKNMSYEDGLLVGMFLGDGSYRNKTEITYSLNVETDQDDIDFLYEYCPDKFGATINEYYCKSEISGESKCVNININSPYLKGLISQFVNGNNALNKSISLKAINCSLDFRRGIIDGLQTTDGSTEKSMNRIYTSSCDLKDSLVALFASMGIVTNITTDERPERLGSNTNYTIRYYMPNNRSKLKDVYFIDDNYMWVKIKSINKVSYGKKSYCLEVMDNSIEPVFTLGNGIVTHNCRLLSDTKKLDAFINSIGGTALSVGSCRVSTINLVRIAYESKFDKKKYIKILKDRVLLDCKALTSMRHIIKRNIEKGLLPNYRDGAVELDKQFCTIGGSDAVLFWKQTELLLK